MVKNDRFLPFFDPKTPFFGIFWHPENPPSKTPFLAVLAPPGVAGGRGVGTGFVSFPEPSEQACVFFSSVYPPQLMKNDFGVAVSRASRHQFHDVLTLWTFGG